MPEKDKTKTEKQLGYTDELMILAEPFRLWAIETSNENVKSVSSFSKADDAVVIASNIEKFRILKLRLLNATHSFTCGLVHLANFLRVKEAVSDNSVESYIHNLMIHEIARKIVSDNISYEDASNFTAKVMDRFRNPYIDHRWLSIAVQYSSKMKMRTVPLLVQHYEKSSQTPEFMALGFAGYILFMKCHANTTGGYSGIFNRKEYLIQDDRAAFFEKKWNTGDSDEVVDAILKDKNFWGADLFQLKGFADRVKFYVQALAERGTITTIKELQKIKV